MLLLAVLTYQISYSQNKNEFYVSTGPSLSLGNYRTTFYADNGSQVLLGYNRQLAKKWTLNFETFVMFNPANSFRYKTSLINDGFPYSNLTVTSSGQYNHSGLAIGASFFIWDNFYVTLKEGFVISGSPVIDFNGFDASTFSYKYYSRPSYTGAGSVTMIGVGYNKPLGKKDRWNLKLNLSYYTSSLKYSNSDLNKSYLMTTECLFANLGIGVKF